MKDITGGVVGFRNAIDFGWDTFRREPSSEETCYRAQPSAAQMGHRTAMVHEQLGVSILPPLITLLHKTIGRFDHPFFDILNWG
jgi:hypothetical protein